MKADPNTEEAVIDVLNKFAKAFTKRDLNTMMTLYAPDSDLIVIGTGCDEKRIGIADVRALLERDFAQFEDASFEISWHSVSASGSVAWLAADANIHLNTGRREIGLKARLTIVLERREDRWFIVQFHGSLPAAEQREGEAFPTYV